MERKYFISVILPLKLEWEPCYMADEGLDIGDRVRVMFAGKEYIAVVSSTEISPNIETSRIKAVSGLEKEMGRVQESEIELWRMVADYYMCTVGEVYKAAYPSVKVNMEQARAEAKKKICEKREKTLQTIVSKLEKLKGRLDRKMAQAHKFKEGSKARTTCLADIEKIKAKIIAGNEAKTAAELNLKAAHEGLTIKDASPLKDTITLSEAQAAAYEEILAGFRAGKPVLLHGVTGAGKTEIYLKLAHKAISDQKNVLYLVPEIALSRQLEDRLQKHFGDRLIIFHSGETSASRRNTAEIIRNAGNGGYILLCTRSGLFLPHHYLGLIIIDEEHDSSYKQDSPAPRYNGRDTALMLSRLHKDSRVILGSATPSLEEIYNTQAGRHVMVRLNTRYHGSDDADIEIIDTKAERLKNGMAGSFSRKLIDRIQYTLNKGEQVILLRSRRAWAGALQCTQCGNILKCPHCNVSLSYHKAEGRMVCHYCGYSTIYSGVCNRCNGQMKSLGAGTQKIEEEAKALFPDATIARLDSDSAQNKTYESKTIREFSAGSIDILIGTQIVAKGFDFSNVSLVAIIAADTLLGIQDFRADEKALHLMEQFRGRCGRRGIKGRLLIQTSQAEHPIYRQLALRNEEPESHLMLERKAFGFPPYSRIIEITLKDIYEDRAERMAYRLAESLGRHFPACDTSTAMIAGPVTGPYRPVVDRIGNQHIRKIRICLQKDRRLTSNKVTIKNILAAFEKDNRYDGHLIIDVDPS